MGLAENAPRVLETAKERVARSPELAPALPRILQLLGARHQITELDVALVTDAVRGSRLSPLVFGQGLFGAVLRSVPPDVVRPLFDVLIDHSAAAFSEAVQMIATYVYGATNQLEEFRTQVRRMSENVSRWSTIPGVAMVRGCFIEIMDWTLRKGREDRDACATALALARALVGINGHDQSDLLTPLVPRLLSSFPEIVWPLVGQALLSDAPGNRPLESLMMSPYGNEHECALLKLPEDTLFAWCHAHPNRAPALAARCLPVTQQTELHRRMARIIDEFGERPGVLQAVQLNMGNFICYGSGAEYLARYDGPLASLRMHQIPRVREWATRMVRIHSDEIREMRNSDEERTVKAAFS